MKMNRPTGIVLGVALLAAWVVANHWIFIRWQDTTYLTWYLANGSVIGLITSIVSLAWGDLNRHVGLISAHPFDYIGSWFQLAGLPVYEIGTHLRSDAAARGRRSSVDLGLTAVIATLVSLAIIVWIFVVVPVQYFVFLVCGAPGRVLSRSGRRVEVRFTGGGQLEVGENPRSAPLREGWWEASVGSKPVALTGIVASLLFALVRMVA